MTIEERTILSPDEIRAIIFECSRCKSKISIPPDVFEFVPETCPNGHMWQSAALAGIGPFPKSLKNLKDSMYDKMGFKIFLEFAEPKRG